MLPSNYGKRHFGLGTERTLPTRHMLRNAFRQVERAGISGLSLEAQITKVANTTAKSETAVRASKNKLTLIQHSLSTKPQAQLSLKEQEKLVLVNAILAQFADYTAPVAANSPLSNTELMAQLALESGYNGFISALPLLSIPNIAVLRRDFPDLSTGNGALRRLTTALTGLQNSPALRAFTQHVLASHIVIELDGQQQTLPFSQLGTPATPDSALGRLLATSEPQLDPARDLLLQMINTVLAHLRAFVEPLKKVEVANAAQIVLQSSPLQVGPLIFTLTAPLPPQPAAGDYSVQPAAQNLPPPAVRAVDSSDSENTDDEDGAAVRPRAVIPSWQKTERLIERQQARRRFKFRVRPARETYRVAEQSSEPPSPSSPLAPAVVRGYRVLPDSEPPQPDVTAPPIPRRAPVADVAPPPPAPDAVRPRVALMPPRRLAPQPAPPPYQPPPAFGAQAAPPPYPERRSPSPVFEPPQAPAARGVRELRRIFEGRGEAQGAAAQLPIPRAAPVEPADRDRPPRGRLQRGERAERRPHGPRDDGSTDL